MKRQFSLSELYSLLYSFTRHAQKTSPRSTQREYGSKPLKHSVVERILEFKR